MTPEEFQTLRRYADERLREAGLKRNKRDHVDSILRFCRTEEQIDESIEQLQRNMSKWFF